MYELYDFRWKHNLCLVNFHMKPVESIFIIYGFSICEFTDIEICKPQINTSGAFIVIHWHTWRWFEVLDTHDSRWCQTKRCSVFSFQLSYCKRCPFDREIFNTHVSHICDFWWWFHHVKQFPSREMKCLVGFLKNKKAVMCFIENNILLDMLCPGQVMFVNVMLMNKQYIYKYIK